MLTALTGLDHSTPQTHFKTRSAGRLALASNTTQLPLLLDARPPVRWHCMPIMPFSNFFLRAGRSLQKLLAISFSLFHEGAGIAVV